MLEGVPHLTRLETDLLLKTPRLNGEILKAFSRVAWFPEPSRVSTVERVFVIYSAILLTAVYSMCIRC